jgi:hypothetical protein
VSAAEGVRHLLAKWANPSDDSPCGGSDAAQGPVALGLIRDGSGYRLVAVIGGTASDRTADIFRAVQSLSQPGPCSSSPSPEVVDVIIAMVERWLEDDRGRVIVRPVTDSPSRAHVAVLKALQQRLADISRLQRLGITKRVEACRNLVLSARGIGAELALAEFARQGVSLDLDALEKLLSTRVEPADSQPRQARLVALMWRCGSQAMALVERRTTGGSRRPGPPRSSTHCAVRDAAQE